MLFKLITSKDIFELNPQLKAIPEFERLTDRQMKYVILATDYKSPLRKLSPDERKTQAAIAAGYKFEKDSTRLDMNGRNVVDGKVGSIIAAVTKYNEIQKDEDYETLMSINELISQIRAANNLKDKSMDDLKKVVEMNVGKLDKLIETKKKIEEILSMREDEQVDPSIGTISDEENISEEDLPTLSIYNDSAFNEK